MHTFYNGKNREDHASSGVAILMHEKYEHNVQNIRETSSFLIISVYASDRNKHEIETEDSTTNCGT